MDDNKNITFEGTVSQPISTSIDTNQPNGPCDKTNSPISISNTSEDYNPIKVVVGEKRSNILENDNDLVVSTNGEDENYDDYNNEEFYNGYDNYYDEDMEYYDDYYDEEEVMNYGDGVDIDTFKNIQNVIVDVVMATGRLDGKVRDDAEFYLMSVLGICSEEQRQELMSVETKTHTALSMACCVGNLKLVKVLVEECKADVNFPQGWPMFWAVQKNDIQIVQYLIEKEANIGICVCQNYSILMSALKMRKNDSYDCKDDNELDKERIEIVKNLMHAAVNPAINYDIVDLLLENQAVEKSSKGSLWIILNVFMRESNTKKASYLEKITDHIDDVDMIQDKNGKTIVETVITQVCDWQPVKTYVEKLICKSKCINDLDIGQRVYNPALERLYDDTTEAIQESFEVILKIGKAEEKQESQDNLPKLHPILYAAVNVTKLFILLLKHPEIPVSLKIDAVELYGARCILQNVQPEGILCWYMVTKMRTLPCSCCSPKDRCVICKKLEEFDDHIEVKGILLSLIDAYQKDIEKNPTQRYEKKIFEFSRRAFDDQLEFETLNQLDSIENQEDERSNNILLMTQAVLVYERLLGIANLKYHNAVCKLAKKLSEKAKYKWYIDCIIYHLSYLMMFMSLYEYPNKYDHDEIFDYQDKAMCACLMEAIFKPEIRTTLNFERVMWILKCSFLMCCQNTVNSWDENFEEERFALFLLSIVNINESELSAQETLEFRKFLKQVIKFDLRCPHDKTLLHYALTHVFPDRLAEDLTFGHEFMEPVHSKLMHFWQFGLDDALPTIQLLLECGADPNAADFKGRSPLHAFFKSDNPLKEPIKNNQIILDMLLEAGAHKDFPDNNGLTPIECSQTASHRLCYVKDRSLQCVVSSYILEHGIPYEGQVTKYQEDFIKLHAKHGSISVSFDYW